MKKQVTDISNVLCDTPAGQVLIPEYWKYLGLDDIVYVDEDGEIKTERWADIEGYEDMYMISDLGRIKGLKRLAAPVFHMPNCRQLPERIKPSFATNLGYRRVEISKDGVNKKFFVHQLVGKAYIPNPDNKRDINHIWGVVWDNRVKKIEWTNPSENAIHSYKVLGRKPSPSVWKGRKPEDHPMYGKKGELSPNWGKKGELNSNFGKRGALCKNSIAIICNETSVRYDGINDASLKLGISISQISVSLINGGKVSSKKLSFKYENHIRQKGLNAKKIKCINTGQIFDSIMSASAELKVGSSKISLVLNGKRTHTGGYKFEKV